MIVKICKHHGGLTPDQCYLIRKKILSCKQCQRDQSDKYRKNKPEKWKSIYKKNNKTRTENGKNNIYYKNSPKRKLIIKKCNDRDSKELTDQYIKRNLTVRSSLKVKDLTPELIDAQRAYLKLVRLIKEKKNE